MERQLFHFICLGHSLRISLPFTAHIQSTSEFYKLCLQNVLRMTTSHLLWLCRLVQAVTISTKMIAVTLSLLLLRLSNPLNTSVQNPLLPFCHSQSHIYSP